MGQQARTPNRQQQRHPDQSPTELPKQLLDRARAAIYLGVTERMIERLWTERKLPAVKVGRFVRFRVADLDSFIEANRIETV